MNHLTWVEVSQSALAHNIKTLKNRLNDGVVLCPCVKANAYGHGLVESARVFIEAGADWLAVNALYEAEALREAGIEDREGNPVPIYIMGYTALDNLEKVWRLGCRQVVYDTETIERLGELSADAGKDGAKFGGPLNLHIKVETGNNRQGVLIEDLVKFAKLIESFDGLRIEGLATHFANIEDTTDHSFAMKQVERFREAADRLSDVGIEVPIKHCSNSAATLLFKEVHFDMVRTGISNYGMWPSNETKVSMGELSDDLVELRPAFTWKAKVAQVKTVPSGDFIGYGCTHRTTRDIKMAIIPIGYYDGYDRGLSNTSHVLIRGKRAKLLGRVCMNIIMADVTDIEGVALEDEVVLMGKQAFDNGEKLVYDEISAEQFADWIGTINYEVTTRINDRIPRIIV